MASRLVNTFAGAAAAIGAMSMSATAAEADTNIDIAPLEDTMAAPSAPVLKKPPLSDYVTKHDVPMMELGQDDIKGLVKAVTSGAYEPDDTLITASEFNTDFIPEAAKFGLTISHMDQALQSAPIPGIENYKSFIVMNAFNTDYKIVGGMTKEDSKQYWDKLLSDNLPLFENDGQKITREDYINGVRAFNQGANSPIMPDDTWVQIHQSNIKELKKYNIIADFTAADLLDETYYRRLEKFEGKFEYSTGETTGDDIIDYSRFDPKKDYIHTVKVGENLSALADRFNVAMGATTQADALKKLNAANAMDEASPYVLQPGDEIRIPLDSKIELAEHTVQTGDTLSKIARDFNIAARADGNAIAAIAKISAIPDANAIRPEQKIIIPVVADGADQTPVAPPSTSDGRKVDLYVTEMAGWHHTATYAYAKEMVDNMLPHGDGLSIHALNTQLGFGRSDFADSLYRAHDSQDKRIFSMSYGPVIDTHTEDETLRRLSKDGEQYFRVHSPNILIAAGNHQAKNSNYFAVAEEGASRNAFIIGASEQNEAGSYTAPYTAYGSVFLSPALMTWDGQEEHGTSLATPMTGAVAGKFSEWYGDTATFEEIMIAGQMSTAIDIKDCLSKNRDFCGPEELVSSQFYTNEAGLPFNPRAGSGQVDVHEWQKNVEKLVELKKNGLDGKPLDIEIKRDQIVQTGKPDASNSGQYQYEIELPMDMTVARIDISAAYESGIEIKTPGGYQNYLGRTPINDASLSTRAVAMEDHKAGSKYTIITEKPLNDDGYVRIYGFEPGNALAGLRDTLQAEGKMLEPMTLYVDGRKETREPKRAAFSEHFESGTAYASAADQIHTPSITAPSMQ